VALPFVPVANTAYVSMRFTQPDGSTASQGFWVKRGAVWTPTLMLDLAAVFKNWWNTGDGTQKPYHFQDSGYALAEIVVRDYTTQTSSVVTYNTGLPIAGTGDPTHALPMGVAFALTLRTGLAGRANRGRTFLMGLTTDFLTSEHVNTVNSGLAADFALAYDALIPAVVAGDATEHLVVVSRYWNNGVRLGPMVSRVAGITTQVLSFGYSNLLLDFQRSRAPGH
jgi:hypothetical protein